MLSTHINQKARQVVLLVKGHFSFYSHYDKLCQPLSYKLSSEAQFGTRQWSRMKRFRDKFNLDRNSPCGQQDSLERCCSSPWGPWHLTISCSIHDTICTVQRGPRARSAPPRLDAQKAEKFITLGLPVTSCQKGKSCHGNKPQKRKCGYYDQTLLSPSWETMLLCGDRWAKSTAQCLSHCRASGSSCSNPEAGICLWSTHALSLHTLVKSTQVISSKQQNTSIV